ncbi:MAG: hypothetical protein GY801_40565 [bacterium]|nr:hypothetical protein [bacterium]
MRAKHIHIFIAIVFAALAVRIGVVFFLSPILDRSNATSIDAQAYHQIARNLVQRQIFTSAIDPPYNPDLPGTFRPPLTPLYLAFWYRLFTTDIFWGRIALALLSAFSCGLIFCLGELIFGRLAGVLAGTLSIGYPFFLLLVHLPLTEGLSIFLCVALLYLLHQSGSQEKSWKASIAVGCMLGLILLNKAANISIMPCILLWSISYGNRISLKKGVLRMLIVLCFATLTILPWTFRNYQVTGAFIPINSNGGWTLYLGNNVYTHINLEALEQGRSNGWVPPKEVFRPFTDLKFTETAAWEARSIQLAQNFIVEDPLRFLLLAWRKLKIFWSPYNHLFDKITWMPILFLSLFGMYRSFSSWQQQLLLYTPIISTMLIPVFFTSMPRFRAPIMPFLILYSAVGLIQLYSLGRRLVYANRD